MDSTELLECHENPRPECLPLVNSEIRDDIFSANSSLDRFYCLYDGWRDIQDQFPKHMDRIHNSRFCMPSWDGFLCWVLAAPGTTEVQSCPVGRVSKSLLTDRNATRTCLNGEWSLTNFTDCFTEQANELIKCGNSTDCAVTDSNEYVTERLEALALILKDIYFFGSIASLTLLIIALLIFSVFKTLQCPRVHIHKNLLISLILQCIVHIILFEPYMNIDPESAGVTYNEIPWLCKTLFTWSNYVSMTNVFWAFVEGLFLYSRISVAVFSTDTPYWLFHLIGWGIPAVFTVAWVICMHVYHKEQDCWRNFSEYTYFWIIAVPILAAVLVNVIFLILIIKILITKLHAVHSAEHVQIRKAMKATIVLLPLLSITSLFFIYAPDIDVSEAAHFAYRITTACLQVAQGIFVSVLFCYFNGEVRSTLLKYWNKWRNGAFRYRSSRASSVCVTQSETMFGKGSPLAMRKRESVVNSSVRSYQHRTWHLVAVGSHRRQSYSSHLSTDNPSSTVASV